MLLQDLFKEENKNLEYAYSITLDENSSAVEFSTPPSNLKEIGFVFKVDSEGTMDETLMDVVINCRLTNIPTLIEVPTQLLVDETVQAKYLIQIAKNVEFSFALLPPGHELVGDSITIEQYKEVIMDVLEKMLAKPDFDKFVYPISNFLEYLMLEQILGKEKLQNFRPENEYVEDNFSNVMTKEHSDQFKSLIRNRLYDFYGGEQEFNLVAQTILDGVYQKTKDIYKDIVVHSISDYSEEEKNLESE